MSYQNGMDALYLRMPKKIPRTEYSASFYRGLVERFGALANRSAEWIMQYLESAGQGGEADFVYLRRHVYRIY